MTAFEPRRKPTSQPAPPPPRVLAAAGAHPVLALQRSAGNRAVAALLQREEEPATGGPVPASPLIDAAVDNWINPKYTDYLRLYDNVIQGQLYAVILRDRHVWKSFARHREADVDVHYVRRRSLTKSETSHIKVTVVATPLEPHAWTLTATLFDWTDGFDTQWQWEATMVAAAGPGGLAYTITEIPPPPPPSPPVDLDDDSLYSVPT